ncbi:MAG TPA: glucosamine-6-phosphate deaminase [Opitutus sp.]|nr:glucosamine-6-phosphate deaminase [Opitutus sp.]
MKSSPPVQQATFGRLAVEVHRDRSELGRAAANACAEYIQSVITARGEARVIFACAPSQDEFLEALVRTGLDWPRVTAFHMDEYVGMPATSPQSFRRYLREHLLDRVPVGRFLDLDAENVDLAAECARYANLLDEKPIDLICLGIGENGHLAFNDPPVADFDDPVRVKTVELEDICRQQQVNDGWYPALDAVPRHALTLTLPVFRDARRLSVHVPGPRKAAAVRGTLHDAITTACPATLLRLHPAATLYLDTASAALAFSDSSA